MEFQLLDTDLCEARLFRASRSFGALTSREITNLLYLDTMLTYMLSQEDTTSESAREYAKKTIQYGTYSLFRTHATDLYMLCYQVLHPNNDYAKIKDPVEGKRFLKNLNFNKQMHTRFVRKIAQSQETRGEAITYLYRLEKQMEVTDGRYRGWRRMITDWTALSYSSKQRVIAQIVQELRRTGSGSGQYTELMFALKPMLKLRKFKSRDPVAKEPSADTAKQAAAAGIGAIAGFWAGRKKK